MCPSLSFQLGHTLPAHYMTSCEELDLPAQAIIEKASIDEVYMDITSLVDKELRV